MSNQVTIQCGGFRVVYSDRNRAEREFTTACLSTDGSESERYCDILSQIKAGFPFATDGSDFRGLTVDEETYNDKALMTSLVRAACGRATSQVIVQTDGYRVVYNNLSSAVAEFLDFADYCEGPDLAHTMDIISQLRSGQRFATDGSEYIGLMVSQDLYHDEDTFFDLLAKAEAEYGNH